MFTVLSSLWESTRFISWMSNNSKCLLTLRPTPRLQVYCCHLRPPLPLSITQLKDDTRYTISWRVEGWVGQGTAVQPVCKVVAWHTTVRHVTSRPVSSAHQNITVLTQDCQSVSNGNYRLGIAKTVTYWSQDFCGDIVTVSHLHALISSHTDRQTHT